MRMNRIVMAALAAMLISQGPAALAQNAPAKGPFIGLSGGFSFTDDSDISGPAIATSAETDTGWLALGTLGYRYGNGVRTELEGGWRDNEVDSVFGPGSGTGDITAKSLMGNLLYDIPTGSRLVPYVGGGLGFAQVEFDGVAPAVGAVPATTIDDDDNVFAYQGIAGVSYWINEAVELSTEYRYMATQDPEFSTGAGVGVDGEYQSHAVLLGLRWNFGAPKPAPAATPAAAAAPAPAEAPEPPALPRNFLVFFDWDKSDITPEAAAILKDAAEYAKANGAVRIMATGHADRSGPDAYNMGLSMRRAEAVKRQLIANGVGESEIGLDAKGEAEPLVQTEDGVREPQNRRVEIVLQ